MIIGASSFALPRPSSRGWDFEKHLNSLRREVEAIELYIPKLDIYKNTSLLMDRVENLVDVLSALTMETTIHAPYFGDSPSYPPNLMVDTAHMGKTHFKLLEESMELASLFEARIVVLHPGKIWGDKKASLSWMACNLRILAKFAEDRGVLLGLENKEGTDPTNLCCGASELLKVVSNVNSPNLKVTFDIGHANLTCGGDPRGLREYADLLREHIAHVHVHDNLGVCSGRYFGDMHGAPGTGNIDFSSLKEFGFDGIFNLEVFSMEDVKAGRDYILGLMG